ncbi:MAG: FAD-binding protein, partial [Pseudomonadota bacterium]
MGKKTETTIWVYGDLRNERFFGFSLNVLAKARDLAVHLSAKTVMVLMGPTGKGGEVPSASEKALSHGSDYVYVLGHDEFARPRADIQAAALARVIQQRRPKLVMVPISDFGRELAARTARLYNAGLISECADLKVEKGEVIAKCPYWGGEIMADIAFTENMETRFVTVLPHAFHAVESTGDPGVIEHIPMDRLDAPAGIRFISGSTEVEDRQKLEEAETVIVGGAGLGSIDAFGLVRELAAVLGGEVGATRPPVLNHWVEEDRLIGQTGKTVTPKLLFSIGTSGAVQYTVGITEAETIIAVNRDKDSPMFSFADIAIVADARTFLPVLTNKLKQFTMRKLADVLIQDRSIDGKGGFGAKVRKLRETHNWTREALAEALGQSPEYIEQVENDEMTPSVSFLLRLAGTMKIDPGLFLGREEKARLRDMRSQAFTKRTENYSYHTLSPGAESDHLRAFMITIEPQQAHKPVAYKHDGEEFIFVIEGDLKITLGNKAHL